MPQKFERKLAKESKGEIHFGFSFVFERQPQMT